MDSKEQTAQSVPSKPPRKRRRWLRILLFTLLTLVVAGAGAGLVYYQRVFGVIRSSEPFQMALEQLDKDPQVVDRLGTPIEEASWFPSGTLAERERGRGEANLLFPVKGPKGTADVATLARRLDGEWGLVTLEVTFVDGHRVSVDTSSTGGGDDAPKYTPPDDQDEPDDAPPTLPEPDTDIDFDLPDVSNLDIE
ncbi:MAG: cytochrome c oxidase assembly factor Coa1 family protein [Planctomycetota bacterium]|jgi:hypothetical protein